MEKRLDFRPLNANEIECRVGNVAKNQDGNIKGFYLLLYKNARVDQCILDETVGQFNWKCNYYQVKQTMVCSVAIWNEERKEWVNKDNGGDDDFNAEQVKAELSDSFKRACFNWGIGRELYYSPKIWVNADKDNDPKFTHYSVKVIEYDKNKRITKLVIINDKTKQVVFSYGYKENNSQNADLTPKTTDTQPTPTVEEPKGSIATEDLAKIRQMISLYQRDESRTKFFAYVEKTYNVKYLEELTLSQGKEIVKMLEK